MAYYLIWLSLQFYFIGYVLNSLTRYRLTPLEVTETAALKIASKYGITRITDTTLLDRIGFPVYAAIRPTARKGSLCVSSGKSFDKRAARIGAVMEALELSKVEYDKERDQIAVVNSLEFLKKCGWSLEDFCLNREHLERLAPQEVNMDIKTLECYKLGSEDTFPIPADLVLFPAEQGFSNYLYATSTNGLSGGNSTSEAILHGTFEVMERHVQSISNVSPIQKVLVNCNFDEFIEIERILLAAEFKLIVTYCENEFDLPMFIADLVDKRAFSTVSVSRGQGLHWNKETALMRAISEAIQSRLTNIHGGRDDIVNRYKHFETYSDEKSATEVFLDRLNSLKELEWECIPSVNYSTEYSEQINELCELLNQHGYTDIFWYDFSSEGESLSFVKVIIPLMEMFSHEFPRVGPKLLEALTNE